jgi:signal transduction histidine kinase
MTRNRSTAARSLVAPGSEREDTEGVQELLHREEERRMLLRAIGHELRSPLTAFSLGIHLVQRDSPSKARILATMDCTVQRMDRLIEEILSLARGDADEPMPKRDVVSLHLSLLKRQEGNPPRSGEKGERP